MSVNEDILKRLAKTKEKVEKFSELLDSISSMDDKRKALWREIYDNALTDRENAYALYINAYSTFGGGQTEHVNVGPIMVKYLERMTKSNEQILKLAEIIRAEQEESSKMSSDDIFDKISD